MAGDEPLTAVPRTDAIRKLVRDAKGYPSALRNCLGDEAPAQLWLLGDPRSLHGPLLGFLSSVRCPGDAILATMDAAVALRDAGVAIIGGFHSPMEKEALRLLLRGQQPVVLCLARGLEGMRIRAEYRQPLEQGRLLLLSPFAGEVRRVTAKTALLRNRVVAEKPG